MMKKSIIKLSIMILIITALVSTLAHCGYYRERVNMVDANIMLILAVGYRQQKCGGTRPAETLIAIQDPTDFALNACMFALFRDPCPFTYYPLICLELYDIDIPGMGPDFSEYPDEAYDDESIEGRIKSLFR